MIVTLIPLLLIITLKSSRCSLVIDSTAQQGLNYSDYCPRMKYCKEGSHVMCMYYDPHNVYGPYCDRPTNVTITAEVANEILDIVNAMRAKIANGKETGMNKELLPRGYGIFRLKWDNELATFAQLLANQCKHKYDLCRATKRFPDPRQNGVRVTYRYPDWKTIVDPENIMNLEPGVTVPKMIYAVKISFEDWYKDKISITAQMIREFPNWNKEPVNVKGKPYIDMIYGPATHMGCGMTGYILSSHNTNTPFGMNYYIQVICNFSAGARTGQYVYETEPPIPNQGYSLKCGCPPGTKEDSDCLCIEDTTEYEQESCPLGESNGNCDSTLVLLPIFTMEDAPPEKLYQMVGDIKDPLKDFILQRVDNSSNVNNINRQRQTETHEQPSAKVSDFNHGKDIENDIWRSPQKSFSDLKRKSSREKSSFHFGPASNPPPPPRRPFPPARPVPRLRASHYQSRQPPPPLPPRIPRPLPPPRKNHNTALKAHEISIIAEYNNDRRNHPPPKLPPRHYPVTKNSSIFTKTPQFTLTNRKRMSPPLKNVKSNAVSRNNNSNLHKVVNDYVKRGIKYEKNNDNLKQNDPKEKQNRNTEYTSSEIDAVVTETGLNKAEEVVINFNEYLKQKNYDKNRDKDVDIKDDNDNKLLSLLDNLEEEVKHVSFDGKERELFDVKLRKIYGTVIGKTASVRFPKPISLNTALLEDHDHEIDFGEIKSVDKLEHEYGGSKVAEEPIKRTKHHQIAKNIKGVKSHDYFTQKRKNKLIESYDDFKPREIYSHIFSDNFDHSNYEDHQYTSDLDHKYNENVNKKKSDYNLDHEYNDVQYKYSDNNYNREHYYHSVKKHDSDILARLKKHEVTKAVFREFGNSQEDASKNVGYHKVLKAYQDTSNRNGLIAKDNDKIKRNERIHRNKVKSLNAHSNLDDLLDLERRKYYQDKLYNIRKKLRSRKNRRDSKNDRSGRQSMQTNNQESSRTKSTKPDYSFMPEGPGFLHGF